MGKNKIDGVTGEVIQAEEKPKREQRPPDFEAALDLVMKGTEGADKDMYLSMLEFMEIAYIAGAHCTQAVVAWSACWVATHGKKK